MFTMGPVHTRNHDLSVVLEEYVLKHCRSGKGSYSMLWEGGMVVAQYPIPL